MISSKIMLFFKIIIVHNFVAFHFSDAEISVAHQEKQGATRKTILITI